MSDKFFFKGRKTPKPAYGQSGFNTKRVTKLGSEAMPADVSVQSEQRAEEVQKIASENQIHINVVIDSKKAENTNELDGLLHKPKSVDVTATQGRNELCLCNSGKKFKKCCGKA